MKEPVRISSAAPAFKSQDFAFLRQEGLETIQRIAADTWTDHNLHDPGITLLEALCYALTEAGLRTGMDMRDLLSSSETLGPQEFFTAARVLPTAPLSIADFQKVLIDHPLINRAWLSVLKNEPFGQWSILLEFEKESLNSNTLTGTVTVAAVNYQVDIAFPHWDDPEAIPLQADVLFQTVTFDGPVGNPWQPVEGTDAFFARINVDYQPQGGGTQTLHAWVVVQVTTPVANPLTNLPLVLQATATLLQTLGDNSPADQSILKQYNRRVTEAFETSRIIRRYLKDYRNICEVFTEFKAVRVQEVAFTATVEVTAGTNVESLLTDIFFAFDQFISPEIAPANLSQLQSEGLDTAAIFEGPLPDNGFVRDEGLEATRPVTRIYVSDLIRLIFQLRRAGGADVETRESLSDRLIVAVRNVSLSHYLDNHSITTDAKDCLQLVNSTRHIPRLSPGKCRVVFYRNGVEVSYDMSRVLALLEQKKADADIITLPESPDLPLPSGETYSTGDYYPVQNDLPLVYGIGEAGLPDTATTLRKAQARQMKGYLWLFEQMLAGHFAQLAHINEFFSAKPDLTTTLFQQTLYHLPKAQDLLRSYNPNTTSWAAFQADGNNPYQQVLQHTVETEDDLLDRRNRLLDHLLARLGEDMQEFAAMTFRRAYAVPNGSSLSLPNLLAAQQKRRRDAARQLIQSKSAFYYDLPDLNQGRAQAFGNLAWRLKTIVLIQATTTGFAWQITDLNGVPVLRQSVEAPTATSARRAAEVALSLATNPNRYVIVIEGGGQRRLTVRESPGANPVALSVNTFGSQVLAQNAIQTISQNLLLAWMENTLSPLECRLYHLLGIPIKQRRKLLTLLTDFFQIYNEPIPNPFFQKRFRLRESTPAGAILLESVNNYGGTNDPGAIAAARAAIADTIRTGVLPENYVIETPAPGSFVVAVLGPDGIVIARSPTTFPSNAAAQTEAKRIRDLLYRQYSLEGFYMVEHILFHPETTLDFPLNIQDSVDPCQPVLVTRKDPYSFQLTFVFPSGFARDFSIPKPVPQPSQPDRFRDWEFRQYAELNIRKACPAHIQPKVVWVDRAVEGTALTGTEPCFDLFETRYRAWLTAYLSDEVQTSVIRPLRNNLITTLNAIYLDSLTN